MSTLTIHQCEVGMKVVLSNPDPNYCIGSNNPKTGTKYECTGRITKINAFIGVKWRNGCINNYKSNELSLIHDVGVCIPIW